jgi:hypothetical protein
LEEKTSQTYTALLHQLQRPFPPTYVHWKPVAIKNGRALAVAYIDARLVMQRMDQVFGPAGWTDQYEFLTGDRVLCTLSAKVDGVWVAKRDIGSPSDQDNSGDQLKAAVSDAFKRAAVKWGIGRYLYNLPTQWLDYDEKKGFLQQPQLPAWAIPDPNPSTRP